MNGLIRGLTQSDNENKKVHVPARADEKDVGQLPAPQEYMVQTEIFPGGRNFR
jgi:hypothetical protein